MTQSDNTVFRTYRRADEKLCLDIFDANCPLFFAPNERNDYESFLRGEPVGYEVCSVSDRVVGAFGLMPENEHSHSLNWIMIDPDSHGQGVGSAIMQRALVLGRASGITSISIAASHKSAPFFAKFGALTGLETKDGWGPEMHRIDMQLKL